MTPQQGHKRKLDYSTGNNFGTPAQAKKRQKNKDARAIPTQTADAALSTDGELNIASYIKAREYEISALDQAMKKSRKGLNARAFQSVPRHMRRRTASHNVKKVPKRLQGRAGREIREDNTPTGKSRRKPPSVKLRLRIQTAKHLARLNTLTKTARAERREAIANSEIADPSNHVSLAKVLKQQKKQIPRLKKNRLLDPPQATSKFKRRQVNKTWLSTHLWHTKRAHMSRPSEPLWRFAIPIRPNEKCYRPTHRASGERGCVCWDMSYMSTVGCRGTEETLRNMLKSLGVEEPRGREGQRKWIEGKRWSGGWVWEGESEEVGKQDDVGGAKRVRRKRRLIAPVEVIWQAAGDQEISEHEGESFDRRVKVKHKIKLDRQLLIRVHPSAFLQFWTALMHAVKTQKPQVLVEDLRFEIGSIILEGPNSTEALVGILKLFAGQKHIEDIWSTLAPCSNPAILPQGALLSFEAQDPRLNHPPKPIQLDQTDDSLNKLNQIILSWPLDRSSQSSKLHDHKTRYQVSKRLPSQKAINRRRADLSPGEVLNPSEKDPRIPIILLAQRAQTEPSSTQGRWVLLAPWAAIDAIWRSLMYFPLSSGNTPRFGGLDQSRQVHLENSAPWFPGDFPGTDAGKAWSRTEDKDRFDAWVRCPPSKRIAWDRVDLGMDRRGEVGNGWSCDWEYLFTSTGSRSQQITNSNRLGQGQLEAVKTKKGSTQRRRKAEKARKEQEVEESARRRNTSSPESDEEEKTNLQPVIKFSQLSPAEARQAFTNVSRSPVSEPQEYRLATVRIHYLTRGAPKPAARVYRLPSAPRTAVSHGTEEGTLTKSNGHLDDAPMLKGSSIVKADSPPQRQSTALLFSDPSQPTKHSHPSSSTLRQKWLALDPSIRSNPHSATDLPSLLGTTPLNHNAQPRALKVYGRGALDLSHIRVLPPPPALEKPGIKDFWGPHPGPKTDDQVRAYTVPGLVPQMKVDGNGDLVEEDLWEKHGHVPCPEKEDLIGYVTSGGYNLRQGAGTAIGGLWIERVLAGWLEEKGFVSGPGGKDGTEEVVVLESREARKLNVTKKESRERLEQERMEKKIKAQKEREKHLCIVRNAGESVGRLAIWELC